MNINFFGNGSGFLLNHTNAFFIKDEVLYIIDCSMLNLEKILELNPQKYKKCIVLITHLHDDHASGLGLFIQKMYYVYKKKLNIFAPSNLLSDICTVLKITGVPDSIYNCINKNDLDLNNFSYIKTEHAPDLAKKCFGYTFELNNKIIIYSGDTCTIEPYKEYINNRKNVEFYIDCSVISGEVHLKYDDIENELIDIAKENEVYLMHIDNEQEMKKKIKNKPLSIVKIKKN